MPLRVSTEYVLPVSYPLAFAQAKTTDEKAEKTAFFSERESTVSYPEESLVRCVPYLWNV